MVPRILGLDLEVGQKDAKRKKQWNAKQKCDSGLVSIDHPFVGRRKRKKRRDEK